MWEGRQGLHKTMCLDQLTLLSVHQKSGQQDKKRPRLLPQRSNHWRKPFSLHLQAKYRWENSVTVLESCQLNCLSTLTFVTLGAGQGPQVAPSKHLCCWCLWHVKVIAADEAQPCLISSWLTKRVHCAYKRLANSKSSSTSIPLLHISTDQV